MQHWAAIRSREPGVQLAEGAATYEEQDALLAQCWQRYSSFVDAVVSKVHG